MSVTLPFTRTAQAAEYRISNIPTDTPYSFLVDNQSVVRDGTVNKRLHWKKLSQPQRSQPLSYYQRWDVNRYGHYLNSHTESGPDGLGGTVYWVRKDQQWKSGDAFAIRDQNVLPSALYVAKARLFDKLKGEGTNVANMLGERKQIVKSVESLLNTIVYTVRDLKRGNISSAIRRMGGDPLTARKLRKKDIADQWLSLQYGWKPLISDIYGLCEDLHKRYVSDNLNRVKVSAKIKEKKASPEVWSTFAGTISRGQVITQAIVSYMCRARLDEHIATLAALGVTNPLEVAWEVTPWSFVVDWFLPVGRYIEQHTAANGWVFYDGCRSELLSVTENIRGNKNRAYTSGLWSYTDEQNIYGQFHTVTFQRFELSSWPIPDVPRFKNPLSAQHVQNSIALLAQLFDRRPAHARTGKDSNGRQFDWDQVIHS
jgi:hypothetical protein